MDRRGFLTAVGLVAAGTGVAAAADEDSPRVLSATARTAQPAGERADAQTLVTFRTNSAERLIALTVDDGPDPRWTPRLLSMLGDHDARATFFVVGSRLQRYPGVVRSAADRGHELGNHTWSHSDLTTHDEAFIARSLGRTDAMIRAVTGQRPRALRPPWGRIDSVGLGVCAHMGYDVVLWSDHVTGSNAAADAARVLHAEPGSIVLAHDGGREPNDRLMHALDGLLGAMTDRGFRFVTVSELLAASKAV